MSTLMNEPKNSRLRRSKFGRALRLESLETRQLMASDVTGTVYADDNRDGVRSGDENGVSGWTELLDANKDGTLNAGEVSRLTNADGDYTFKNVADGNVRVATLVQAGWVATSPTSRDLTLPISGGAKTNFLVFSGGEIEGTVWNDANQDGIQTIDENGLEGWRVFLDSNKNETFDVGERSVMTDASGYYLFSELPPGDYEVTEVLPAGWDIADTPGADWKQTVAVSRLNRSTQDFPNFTTTSGSIKGSVYNDLNADGTLDETDTSLADWTIFIDANSNDLLDTGEVSVVTDENGEYLFLGLNAGDYEVAEVLPDGWNLSPGYDLRQTVSVSGGESSTADDFLNFTSLNGGVSGTIWNDINRNGVRDFDSTSGLALDPPLVGWTVFLDLNRNSAFDPGEPQATTGSNGDYLFDDLQVGEYEVREMVPSNWEATVGFDDSYSVKVVSGVITVAHDFANFDATGSGTAVLDGTIWNDLNSNGVFETGEPGLSGWTVFLDSNNDGLLGTGERQTTTSTTGTYSFQNLTSGTIKIVVSGVAGWHPTAPATGARAITIRGGVNVSGVNFGEARLLDSSISGSVYVDKDGSGVRNAGDRGLPGVVVYLDTNDNGLLDEGEPQATTSTDQFYTPSVDEAGTYSFTHLETGRYVVRAIVPETLSATPAAELSHVVTIDSAENRVGVDTKAVYRPNEIHGVKFDDTNGNHVRDASEPGVAGATIFVDLNRNNVLDAGEPSTLTETDGSYKFTGLASGAYVLRELTAPGYRQTAPNTVGGILWPAGTSNPASGNVTPGEITKSLTQGESYRTTVTITLPNNNALTNLVDVFLLFDDTGSFTYNSPIVRAAFPDIISRLQTSLPGIDMGFGVGRMEEYANFAYEYSTGRPFVLNQPIVAASSSGYMTAIQAALDRTAPGYGGDEPETDIEALYQLVTGKGFDGNNNGTVLDSGVAGLAATQVNPGNSGDVPSFASFRADPANSVMPAAGNVGGAGFRSGALPIVLLATDTGFAYQPKGESGITGSGVTLPLSQLTETSRATTPYNSGAGIQETVTALNALGALVIGLGTNAESSLDPRQQLEALSTLTGATNRSTTTIANGTTDPIAPGDPLYFQISSGFGTSVANGVVSAIQNAVRSVAVDIDVVASDPRVHIINHTGVVRGVAGGQTATYDIEFVGDGIPHRFDLQFVRAGTSVVLGSIPVVLGTPITGDCYEFDEIEDGEIEVEDDFGSYKTAVVLGNQAPSFVGGANVAVAEDAGIQTIVNWATSISPGPATENSQAVDFQVSNNNSALFAGSPTIAPNGTLSFTPAANAFGSAVVVVRLHDNGGTADGGIDTSAPQTFTITVSPVNDAPVAVGERYTATEDIALNVGATASVLVNDSDIDSPVLTATVVNAPAHGALVLQANGAFTYTSTTGYTGGDSFTYVANDGSLNSSLATVTIQVQAVSGAAKFYVVDGSSRSKFGYDASGVLTGESKLSKEDAGSRGIATSKDGSTTWVIDKDAVVFVYNSTGKLVGTWKADGIDKPEGITTDDTNVWIVDREKDRVFYFAGAASRKSGEIAATSSFALNNKNLNAMDIVGDGSRLWVINDTGSDQIFRYSTTGVLQGSWKLDARNTSPTGIAIDPHHVDHLWVVDSGTDSVYQYDSATGRTSGSQNASTVFALASGNNYPQGIADPPSAPTWTNLSQQRDVNDDGYVTPLDVLQIINRLNTSSEATLAEREVGLPYWDVNGDGFATAKDALEIINALNTHQPIDNDAHDAAIADWFDDELTSKFAT